MLKLKGCGVCESTCFFIPRPSAPCICSTSRAYDCIGVGLAEPKLGGKRPRWVNRHEKPEARASRYDPINALSVAVAIIAACGLVWIALTEWAGFFPF